MTPAAPPRGRSPRRLAAIAVALVLALGTVVAVVLASPWEDDPPPTAAEMMAEGDPVRGGDVYTLQCASCHGPSGEGHIGPTFLGNPIPLDDALEVIRTGSGEMPGGLVASSEEADVLAFLGTMLALQDET